MSNNNKNQQIKTPLDLITKPYNKNVVTVTDTYQLKYQFQYNTSDRANRYWNNEGDAFKHTYMQADLSFKFGRPIASIPGYWHEAQNLFKGNSKNETNMDLWNNKIGRQIGQEVLKEMREKHKLGEKKKWKEIDDAIAEKIMQKMRNDELITSPDDPRARTLIEKFKNNSKIPKNWQEYLNTPKDFSKLQPSKLDELKTPTVQGVGNNTVLVDNSELLVQYPAPIINTSTNWLSTLGQTFSTTASLQIQE